MMRRWQTWLIVGSALAWSGCGGCNDAEQTPDGAGQAGQTVPVGHLSTGGSHSGGRHADGGDEATLRQAPRAAELRSDKAARA